MILDKNGVQLNWHGSDNLLNEVDYRNGAYAIGLN